MKHEVIGYSSVRGALHEKSGLPNQDSYLVKQFQFGTLLVVSDGMGSHLHSDFGSHSVCRSVSRAVQLWQEYHCDDIRLLIPLLHSLWGMDVFPYPKNECGATCLFAFLSNENVLYLGQLGDGSIFYSIGDELALLKNKGDEFANLTTGMDSIKSFGDWSLAAFCAGNKPVKLCLMTDGVAETLVESRRDEFVKLLWKRLAEKNNVCERNNMIYRLLKDWNPVNAGDDRTLVGYERK
jgi:Serine/threonine protein phosphatase